MPLRSTASGSGSCAREHVAHAGSLAELERERSLIVRVGGREIGVLCDEGGGIYERA